MILLFLAALAVDPPDSVPLRVPPLRSKLINHAGPIAGTVTVQREEDFHPAVPSKYKDDLVLGAAAQVAVISGALRGGVGVAAILAYRLPFLSKRLAAFVEPGLSGLWGSDDVARFSGLWFALPLGLSFREHLPGPGDLRVSAALTVDYSSMRASVQTAQKLDRFWTLGFFAGVGYEMPVGSMRLVFDVRYRLLPYSSADKRIISHGVILSTGFVYGVL